MAFYAISDLHLPGGDVKPMDVFGEHWTNHFEKISADWRDQVTAEDVVLLPGDFSWAMALKDAVPDLMAVGALPGKKVLLRGNHDYWWSAIGRVRDALPEGMYAVQNDCVELCGRVICGTRGWNLPGEQSTADDIKVYKRELLRLEMTLKEARRRAGDALLLCMMHYPPLTDTQRDTEFTALLEQYGAGDLVYGHLHGIALKGAFRGEHNGIRYHQVSCDGLGFRMYRLPEGE